VGTTEVRPEEETVEEEEQEEQEEEEEKEEEQQQEEEQERSRVWSPRPPPRASLRALSTEWVV
jgi:hypothetical protein